MQIGILHAAWRIERVSLRGASVAIVEDDALDFAGMMQPLRLHRDKPVIRPAARRGENARRAEEACRAEKTRCRDGPLKKPSSAARHELFQVNLLVAAQQKFNEFANVGGRIVRAFFATAFCERFRKSLLVVGGWPMQDGFVERDQDLR